MPFLDTIDKTIIWEKYDYERAYVYNLDPDARLIVTCVRGFLGVDNYGTGGWVNLTEGQSTEIYPVSDWLDMDGALQLYNHGESSEVAEALLSYGSSDSGIGTIAAVSSQLDQTGKERIHISSGTATGGGDDPPVTVYNGVGWRKVSNPLYSNFYGGIAHGAILTALPIGTPTPSAGAPYIDSRHYFDWTVPSEVIATGAIIPVTSYIVDFGDHQDRGVTYVTDNGQMATYYIQENDWSVSSGPTEPAIGDIRDAVEHGAMGATTVVSVLSSTEDVWTNNNSDWTLSAARDSDFDIVGPNGERFAHLKHRYDFSRGESVLIAWLPGARKSKIKFVPFGTPLSSTWDYTIDGYVDYQVISGQPYVYRAFDMKPDGTYTVSSSTDLTSFTQEGTANLGAGNYVAWVDYRTGPIVGLTNGKQYVLIDGEVHEATPPSDTDFITDSRHSNHQFCATSEGASTSEAVMLLSDAMYYRYT